MIAVARARPIPSQSCSERACQVLRELALIDRVATERFCLFLACRVEQLSSCGRFCIGDPCEYVAETHKDLVTDAQVRDIQVRDKPVPAVDLHEDLVVEPGKDRCRLCQPHVAPRITSSRRAIAHWQPATARPRRCRRVTAIVSMGRA